MSIKTSGPDSGRRNGPCVATGVSTTLPPREVGEGSTPGRSPLARHERGRPLEGSPVAEGLFRLTRAGGGWTLHQHPGSEEANVSGAGGQRIWLSRDERALATVRYPVSSARSSGMSVKHSTATEPWNPASRRACAHSWWSNSPSPGIRCCHSG